MEDLIRLAEIREIAYKALPIVRCNHHHLCTNLDCMHYDGHRLTGVCGTQICPLQGCEVHCCGGDNEAS